MLSPSDYDALVGRVVDQPVRDALNFLLGAMHGLGGFEMRPNVQGKKKSVHFAVNGVSNFAFIANNHWLLWYFRKPGFTSGRFDWSDLERNFPDIKGSDRSDPEEIEVTLRITSLPEAAAVVSFIQRTCDP